MWWGAVLKQEVVKREIYRQDLASTRRGCTPTCKDIADVLPAPVKGAITGIPGWRDPRGTPKPLLPWSRCPALLSLWWLDFLVS